MTNIYVGNLSFKTTEDQIQQAFSAFGQVERVSLITDRATGRPRGFGFVEMSNPDEAQAAITGLNGKDLDGRTLTVNEAKPKTDRGGRGGGGGRGGSGGYRGGRDRY